MMSAVYSVHLFSTFVFRYLANLVKERDGFELVIEVRWYWFLERYKNNGQWILIDNLKLEVKLSWLNFMWLLVHVHCDSFFKNAFFLIIELVWVSFFFSLSVPMFVSGTYRPAWGTRPEMLIGGRDWERYMYKHTLNITENVAFIGNDLLLYLAEFGQEENLSQYYSKYRLYSVFW